jgi:diacylglycerol O-acyltransferase / wax synthase
MSVRRRLVMKRAGPLDAAFFGLETPGHPLHGMAVMVLDPTTVPGGYSFAKLRRFIAGRLPGVPPLRQRSVPLPMGVARPGWVDTDVDIRDHVIKHVRSGATLGDVASYAAEFASTSLDRTKPLWAMHVIEGLEDGTVAIVAKVHHSLMDGVAGMDFLASMFSLRPEAETAVKVDGGTSRVPNSGTRLAVAVSDLLTTPVRLVTALFGTGRAGWRLGALARRHGSLLFPRPPRMRWNGELGSERTVALTSLSLAEVKDVSHSTGTTVNDVVLSVIGGACRTYLDKCGELPTKPLVAFVPVSTHDTGANPQSHETSILGNGKSRREGAAGSKPRPLVSQPANAVALVLSTLATDASDPLERLNTVHEAMVQAKRMHDALGGDTLTKWLAVVNPLVLGAAARIYLGLGRANRAPLVTNILVSNVPGPPVPLYFGGARLLGLYPLGPVYDGIGVNVTVVSCEGVLGFGLVSSPKVLDDAEALAHGLAEEFTALRRACGARARSRARRATPVASER